MLNACRLTIPDTPEKSGAVPSRSTSSPPAKRMRRPCVRPGPLGKDWVAPNLPYGPSPRELTMVQKHVGVVSYLRRNRTTTVLDQQ